MVIEISDRGFGNTVYKDKPPPRFNLHSGEKRGTITATLSKYGIPEIKVTDDTGTTVHLTMSSKRAVRAVRWLNKYIEWADKQNKK